MEAADTLRSRWRTYTDPGLCAAAVAGSAPGNTLLRQLVDALRIQENVGPCGSVYQCQKTNESSANQASLLGVNRSCRRHVESRGMNNMFLRPTDRQL